MPKKTVVITDTRSEEALCAADYLRAQGYDVQFIPEEISLCDEVRLAEYAKSLSLTLHAVIHPAPPKRKGGIEEISEDDWIRAREEGPIAAFCVTKAFAGIFREKGWGSVIYLNSIHAEKPVGKGMLFSTGCGAVQMLMREANQDYGEQGVNFFFIQSGILEGEEDMRSDVSPVYFGVDMRYPTKRIPAKDHLNGLIAFLLTDAAGPLTGSDLRADGGMSMYYLRRGRREGVGRNG